MNIYRATISYNNGDTCEWEEHYEDYSPWYPTKELAEQHFPELQKRADFLRHIHTDNGAFYCSEPYIETKEVLETLGTIEDGSPYYSDNLEGFKNFEYLEHDGWFESRKTILTSQCTSSGIYWRFTVIVDGEYFDVTFRDGKVDKCEKCSQETESNFYRYSKEIRQKFLNFASEYLIEDVLPIYQKAYEKERSSYEEYDNTISKSKKVTDKLWTKWVSCEYEALIDLFDKYEWLRISEWEYNSIKSDLYSHVERDNNEIAKTIVKLLELIERGSRDYGSRIIKY